MATIKSWIDAARPRTLPLALSGIFMGCGLSWFYGEIKLAVSILAIITATLIQIFSNFANDYGDGHRGTDNHRLGPARTIQSGKISKKRWKTACWQSGTEPAHGDSSGLSRNVAHFKSCILCFLS